MFRTHLLWYLAVLVVLAGCGGKRAQLAVEKELTAANAAGTKRPRRIAIVPLQNLRPNTDTDWIGVGAAETLTTKLGELPDLITVERTRIGKIIEEQRLQAALSDIGTAAKVGKLARAERMLIGSYAKMGANIQFNIRVVDVATSVVLNRASVVRPEAKIFDALYALAEAVIESFKKKGVVVDKRPAVIAAPRVEHIILTEEQARMLKERGGTTSLGAFKAYCEGCDADDVNEKIRRYTEAIALDRKYAWAYGNRGVAFADKGEYGRAIRDYDRVIALNPKSAKAYCNRGTAYAKKGEYDRAIRDYDKAIALNPKHAEAYNNRGLTRYKMGDYDRATRNLDRAIHLDPSCGFAYHNRGLVHVIRKEYSSAIRDFGRAIELDWKRELNYCCRGSAYRAKGEYDRAIRDYNQAIALNPRFVGAYNNRGNAYLGKGEYDRAIRDFDRAIELDPKYAMAYYNRGNVYNKKDEHDRAIRDFDKAIELDPKCAGAYYSRGAAYYLKRKYDHAIGDFGRAIELNPRDANACKFRALAYYHNRNYAKAWADVKACQRLGENVHPEFLADLRKASGRDK